MSKAFNFFYYLFLAFSSLVLIIIYKYRFEEINHWLFFSLWSLLFLASLIFSLYKYSGIIIHKIRKILKEDARFMVILLILTLSSRFFMLQSFPFVRLGDELRDAGLDGMRIREGSLRDFFSFGSYQGYGRFIPLISFLFSFLFKNSPLMYLLPAAIVGSLSIFVTYLLGRLWLGRRTAFIGSLFLVGSLYHLFYSRTELVNISDTLIAPLIILAGYSTYFFAEGFFLTGLIGGLSFHFYSTTKSILITVTVFIFLRLVWRTKELFKARQQGKLPLHIKKMLLLFMIFAIGFLVGIGPTVVKEKWYFAQADQLIFLQQDFKEQNWTGKITTLFNSYHEAFLLYVFRQSSDPHDNILKPILSFPLNWFFILGLLFLLINIRQKRDKLTFLIILLLLIFPFSNGTLVTNTQYTHRWLSILPLANLTAAYGFNLFIEKVIAPSVKYRNFLTACFVIVILGFQFFSFFVVRQADSRYNEWDYKIQKIFYFTQNTDFDKFYVLLFDGKNGYEREMSEPSEFYFPAKDFEVFYKPKEFFDQAWKTCQEEDFRTLLISLVDMPASYCLGKRTIEVNCSTKSLLPRYECPLEFRGNYNIYFYSLKEYY